LFQLSITIIDLILLTTINATESTKKDPDIEKKIELLTLAKKH